MTPVIAGSINRTPTGPHRRCDMFIDYCLLNIEYLRKAFLNEDQSPIFNSQSSINTHPTYLINIG
jgi:hypothetical protein